MACKKGFAGRTQKVEVQKAATDEVKKRKDATEAQKQKRLELIDLIKQVQRACCVKYQN